MKKNHIINVPVTKDEKKKIEKKAERYGLNVSAFIRHIALRGKIKIIIEDV